MNNKVLAQDFNCKAHFRRGLKKGFTLAEVLITLAIIGVVAAMTIPAVIVNTNQMEFKTGLRKAVSVLNSAITLNKALTGESPYDNSNLYEYLQQHMAIMARTLLLTQSGAGHHYLEDAVNYANKVFYTTDGMRYEFLDTEQRTDGNAYYNFRLYESGAVVGISGGSTGGGNTYGVKLNKPGNCGSMGLAHNPDRTTEYPCIIQVDVNGDRKPSPTRVSTTGHALDSHGRDYDSFELKKANPNGKLLTDSFSIIITDQGAIPYGVVAQKAMYQAQK